MRHGTRGWSARVALKILSPLAASADAVERLWREARILARLEHPGIVPIHDAGMLSDGRAYYAMKLVEGFRLDEYLRAGQSISCWESSVKSWCWTGASLRH
jgi:serine/threonine protein kinase